MHVELSTPIFPGMRVTNRSAWAIKDLAPTTLQVEPRGWDVGSLGEDYAEVIVLTVVSASYFRFFTFRDANFLLGNVTVNGLKPNTTYEVTVQAVGKVGTIFIYEELITTLSHEGVVTSSASALTPSIFGAVFSFTAMVLALNSVNKQALNEDQLNLTLRSHRKRLRVPEACTHSLFCGQFFLPFHCDNQFNPMSCSTTRRTFFKDIQQLYETIGASTDGQATILGTGEMSVRVSLRPKSGCNAHAEFILSIKCTSSYPRNCPDVTFSSPIFHPNIDSQSGSVCLSLLSEWQSKASLPHYRFAKQDKAIWIPFSTLFCALKPMAVDGIRSVLGSKSTPRTPCCVSCSV
ncbi:hypothetical protein EGR_10541 [Echinococcus granulosus]|uniref:UBC core domain-containing protein n=1 Tax=Echinococcus granulosus TaxID=6210 RepID=W6U0P8_ECHGR|nr:hypothetical protein EGR_10541 [Echinococcus granulosus]EUB54603.1 hypothetical protein EGR_10541 [Echinococcus granulosus]